MNGYINGNLMIDGPVDMLALSSKDASIENAELTIAYTGVPYIADGPFHIDETGVYFDNITIRDRYNGRGTVNGSINYDYFRDITFDTKISVDMIEAVNLQEKEADVFYGNLFGSGDIHITGPTKAIVMDIKASTAKAGDLHIPISSSLTSSKGTNLLKFKELDIQEDFPNVLKLIVKVNWYSN